MSQCVETVGLEIPTFPLRSGHVIERLVDGELLLYDPTRQRVHALNPTAAYVWRACDGKREQDSIVAELAGHYPDHRAEIERDLPEIIKVFLAEGLVER